ncbi:MAG: hypothetical protein R2865_16885, partial [Deinococcales bacterium]
MMMEVRPLSPSVKTDKALPEGLQKGFYLKLLGTPRIYLQGMVTKLGTRKALALMSYLAIEQDSVQRHQLDGLLWPDKDEKRARRSLRDEISRINRTLDMDCVEARITSNAASTSPSARG